MAARSTLTVTSGTTITSAWGNSVRDHAVPYTTSNDVTTEGMLAVNTSTDRLMVYDGSAAYRLAHYSSTGRTWVSADFSGAAIGSATTAQLSWTTISDADAFYTGWNGTNYNFTVPTGLGGLYVISASVGQATGLSSNGQLNMTIGGTFQFAADTAVSGGIATLTVVRALVPTEQFNLSMYNGHSGSLTFSGTITVVRLGA
jgi:hypothetical protein